MPKRSTGCFECRKRKVRCDEAKPECNTCLRRGTKCPGYRPLQSFILHRFEEKSERPSLIKEDDNRYRYANHKAQEEETSSGESEQGVVGLLQPPGRRASGAPVLRQVSPIAIERVQHIGELIWLYLPRSDPHTLPPPSALMLTLPQLPATSDVLLAAVDALSAAQLAVANRNYQLVNRSRSLYGTALSKMMHTIQYPDRAVEDETLLATYLLTLYEVFVGITSGHGFFYHVQGLLRLVKQRGPKSFGNRLNMQIFHAIRYNSLSIGYHVRKGSMLDSPSWMAVTASAAKSDPYVALIDICIRIPRLLERTDTLSTPLSPAALDALIADSLALAAEAKSWFSTFEKHGPRYTSVPISDFEGFTQICDDKETFPEAYDFFAFGAGICYMIYWMSLLILQSNTFKLLLQNQSPEHPFTPQEMYLWDRELSGYADSSVRCVPFNCRTEVGYVGRFGSLTPLVVARKYFEAKKMERESAWCEKVYQNARIPGLYSTPIPMEPLKSMQRLVQRSGRYI
ncbi:hypothetical protein BU23DRAFT_584957 [Bimuria novae-zelandiae CBS 107.79]|uniref:Zn(2)-C6 fungal-type domain-containing protein n=1 Tax=Bimuria novae-zelandiae CBS 107.79 TaxID=1447943 RepID=A0A6A5URT0_9PLEO|nr:hypothetical protein BU23DRAFT_584957 [Bimuria novae-zelandiae CBS 107.79]